ncbi:HNH endonuclease [Comamonas sp.]|uniref:HNH endonuclease n=1 Tax=Comamonas sp. TaxID=34028 RepID=UPI003D0F62B5
MAKYWWVNHNQTFEQERGEGYLWSPKREANGARSQFYENMRIARTGDMVVSFADTRIKAVGRVANEAVNSRKPITFGAKGANWADNGWLLPVSWTSLHREPRPLHHLPEIAPLLPPKYSPINSKTGFGNQKAYLAEISEALFLKVLELTEGPLTEITPACDADTVVRHTEDAEVQQLYQELELSDTERANVVAARWGQGIFRTAILALDGACVITGVSDPRLLKASHIKPWRLCKTAAERLSPMNGLLLTPTFDQLFDKGLMTFDDHGSPVLSSALSPADVDRLGLGKAAAKYSLNIHAEYLAFHRNEIFIP